MEQNTLILSLALSQNTPVMRELEEYVQSQLENELKIVHRSFAQSLTKISAEEKAIIFKYTDDGYDSLNEKLRDSKGTKISEYGEHLESVLSKLDCYEGVVYRGTKSISHKLAKYWRAYVTKEVITEYAFVSASRKKGVARQFGTILFEILSKNGKLIENISKFGLVSGQNEYEILFHRNSKFLITGFEKQDIYTLITMEEI